MKSAFDLTIAISSFNSEDKIEKTLLQLFESDLSGLQLIELIVIDDGSPSPVRDVIERLGSIPENFELRLLEQKNSGIGTTRNRGFREARADLVLFLDDDILVRKDTVKAMIAAHKQHPGGIIFGSYPFVTHESKALERFARELYSYDEITEHECFEKVEAITSGLLAVDKAKLNGMANFYEDDMTIPAAEEHEIISRFHKLGIPIYHARHISAIHNHHLELDWLVNQQYKYGLATAEAFAKHPEIAEVERFSRLRASLDDVGGKGLRRFVKQALATSAGSKAVFICAKLAAWFFPNGNHNSLFELAANAGYWRGYKEGLKRF